MPFNKTEVRNKLRGILSKIYAMDERGEVQIENFAEFTQALENLWLQSAELYQKDKEGKYKALDADAYRKLIGAYGNALEKANNVLLQSEGNNALHELTTSLTSILYTDMNSLENIVPGNNITLPEVIEKGRSATIDLGNVQLVGSGNAMSNRIPIEYKMPNGEMRKGFFTKKLEVPSRNDVNNSLKPVEEKYPEFKSFFNALNALDDAAFFNLAWVPLYQFDIIISNSPNPTRAELDMSFAGLNLTDEEKNTLCNNEKFMQCMHDTVSAASPIVLGNQSYCDSEKWLGGKEGERIDNRNSAMSMVSKMLGFPDLVAPAEPMTIIVNGEKIEGTFMENAYGKEMYGIDSNDPIRDYGIEHYDNPEVFSQIADTQVIDYICGNIDRHEGNFFMQFDGEGPNAKLSKLTLIDNDLSFGKNLVNKKTGNKFVEPKKMGIIDKDTSLKVMAMTKSTLMIGLKGCGLSDEQIDFAWQRTQKLQQQITASIEAYKDVPEGEILWDVPRIVSKEDMSKYSLEHISEIASSSQFEVFSRVQKLIENHEYSVEEAEQKEREFNNKYGLVSDPPKPKAVRLTGNIVRNDIFIQPDKELDQKPLETVDVEIEKDAVLDSVGGAMSSRRPISYIDENGIEQKGFFTSRIELDFKKQANNIFREVSANYPEFSDYISILKEHFDNGANLSLITSKGLPGYSKDDVEALASDKRFSKMQKSLIQGLAVVEDNTTQYVKGMGASAEGSIDMRNVGMTRVAELMGNDKLLANSKPMRLKQGNKIVEGVFMELANGVDFSGVHEGDPITEYTEDVYNYGPGLKSLSNMQILDYICMNVDRHHANIMYQFEEVNGQTKLVGVQGIDNDMSFFTMRVEADKAIQNTAALNDIQVISEEQAKFIKEAKPEDIEAALGGCGLSVKDIAATVERVDRLRERINNNQIQVLSDEEWNQKTLSSLSSGQNIFSRVKNNMIGPVIQRKAVVNGPREEKKPLQFAKGEKREFTDEYIKEQSKALDEELESKVEERNNREMTLAEKIIKERVELKEAVKEEHMHNLSVKDPFSKDGLSELKTKLAALNAVYKKSNHLFGGSPEYKNAERDFKDLKALIDSAPNRLNNANELTKLEFIEEIKEQLQFATASSSALIEKTANSANSNQKDRNVFAQQLATFSQELTGQIKDYNMAVLENQNEINTQRFAKKAQPLKDYCKAKYPGQYNPRKENELLDYKISSGMRYIASNIALNHECDKKEIADFVAAYILKESINVAVKKNGEKAMEQFNGKIKNMVHNTAANEYVQELSNAISKNPEGFANIITSGKLPEVYKDFVKKENIKLKEMKNNIIDVDKIEKQNEIKKDEKEVVINI